MTSARPVRRIWWKTALLSIVGLGILGILIAWANPARVVAVMRSADAAWIGLAVLAIIGATIIGAVNSFFMTVQNAELTFPSFLGAYWCSWGLGQLVPGQVGDVIGISLYLRRRGISLPSAVGRLGVDKLISLFAFLVVSGGLLIVYDAPAPRLAGALGLCAACVMLIAYSVSLRWNISSTTDGGFVAKIVRVLVEAHAAMKNRPVVVAINLLLTIFKLFLVGVCYWATFRAFHFFGLKLFDATITANSAGLVAYVPISANGLGTVEATATYLFDFLGIAPPIIIAAYLTIRIAGLTLALGGTAIVLFLSAVLS
jgi:uncharacterized membrane protein YbhN (UPF0104 family)